MPSYAASQRPSALARSISARPAGRIRPAAISASTFWRLTFDHVQQMLDAHRPRLPAAVVDHLRVGPVPVSLEGMDDEEIARASAAEIYRALTDAV